MINLLISVFSIIKTKALECVSVVNRKCMPRPKILDVNEGVGEALFYPYNVLVKKCCSGSCNTLDDPMAKLSAPSIVKICRLNSSVCNSKQIWNSDTCRCDCNEDFPGVITCNKGYMWNPSTWRCECDIWCKPSQYLDYKNCIYKNKLIGRVIAECTSVINETMINNKDNIDKNNTITNIFIGLFSVVMFVVIVCFCVFTYFKWFKGKKLFKNKYTDVLCNRLRRDY